MCILNIIHVHRDVKPRYKCINMVIPNDRRNCGREAGCESKVSDLGSEDYIIHSRLTGVLNINEPRRFICEGKLIKYLNFIRYAYYANRKALFSLYQCWAWERKLFKNGVVNNIWILFILTPHRRP